MCLFLPSLTSFSFVSPSSPSFLSSSLFLPFPSFFSSQTYSTGRTNVLLNMLSILQWIGNAMMYAVVVCLMSYNVLFPTFYYLDLYTAGTIVMIGLVIALQFKVMFFHHQWSSYHIHSMLFSFYAMFLFYMLIAATVDDYWNGAIKVYNEPITWLWGLFTVPFTAVFIDWFAYFSRYFLFPTQEMIYREMEKSVSFFLFCFSLFVLIFAHKPFLHFSSFFLFVHRLSHINFTHFSTI